MTAELQHNGLFVTDDSVTVTVTDSSPPPPPPPPPPTSRPPSNKKPTFDDGANATRSVPENTSAGVNIGDAVSATDSDGDTLTYSLLAGTDASSFTLLASSGQLRTKGALNHEVKSSYTVTVRVNDGKNSSGGSSTANDDSITVTITVTDVNEAPVVATQFPSQTLAVGGGSTTISLSDKFSDPDGDTLSYSAVSSDTSVVTESVSVSGSTLTIVPVAAGTARVGVTTTDPGGLVVAQGFNVTVEPPPSIPTGLRANGDLVSGNITLRWNEEPGATGYDVRYTEEICDSDGKCAEDAANWQTELDITTSGSGVKEAALGGLTKKTLYRVEVRSVKWGALSGWSDFVLAFPTDSALDLDTHVATAPFHGYQAKNAQGSHEFRYILCESSIPAGLTMNAWDMKRAMDKWEDTVIWDRGRVNIITTSSYPLPAGDSCARTAIPHQKGRFEVQFLSDGEMRDSCNPLLFFAPWKDAPVACWRSRSYRYGTVKLIDRGAVLINVDKGLAFWNTNLGVGCTKLHEILVHEVDTLSASGKPLWMTLTSIPKTRHSRS